MSVISSTSNASATSGISQQTAASQSAAVKTSSGDKSADVNSSSANESTIELSTRAQKIQKLAEEFFPAGPQSIKITAEFIERLQEYGFLNAEEAKRLSPAKQSDGEQIAKPLSELSAFIDDFTATLKNQDSQSSLIDVLQKAQSIIEDLDGSNAGSGAIDIKNVVAELGQYTASDKAQLLSADDQRSLQQLEIALHVADKLVQQDNRSEQINRYLSILNQLK